MALPARAAGGVLTDVGAVVLALADTFKDEFFLLIPPELAFFLDRVLVPPTPCPEPEPRFRFLITSVFKLSGRTTPCNFRKRPQALQRG